MVGDTESWRDINYHLDTDHGQSDDDNVGREGITDTILSWLQTAKRTIQHPASSSLTSSSSSSSLSSPAWGMAEGNTARGWSGMMKRAPSWGTTTTGVSEVGSTGTARQSVAGGKQLQQSQLHQPPLVRLPLPFMPASASALAVGGGRGGERSRRASSCTVSSVATTGSNRSMGTSPRLATVQHHRQHHRDLLTEPCTSGHKSLPTSLSAEIRRKQGQGGEAGRQAGQGGATRSHTRLFKRLRKPKLDRQHLESTRLQKRLTKLVSLLSSTPPSLFQTALDRAPSSASWVSRLEFGGRRRELEQSVVAWDERGEKCYLCGMRFGWVARRHHCRLCGRAVCGRVGCCVVLMVRREQASAPAAMTTTTTTTETTDEASVAARESQLSSKTSTVLTEHHLPAPPLPSTTTTPPQDHKPTPPHPDQASPALPQVLAHHPNDDDNDDDNHASNKHHGQRTGLLDIRCCTQCGGVILAAQERGTPPPLEAVTILYKTISKVRESVAEDLPKFEEHVLYLRKNSNNRVPRGEQQWIGVFKLAAEMRRDLCERFLEIDRLSQQVAHLKSSTPMESRLHRSIAQAQLQFVQKTMLTLSLLPRPEGEGSSGSSQKPKNEQEKEYIRILREQITQVSHYLGQARGTQEKEALKYNLEELKAELERVM